jgi:hypothetical protein
MDTYLEKSMYHLKKVLGMNSDPPKATMTTTNLNNQHPSWKTEANVFLANIMQKTTAWKHASTKLILIIAEGPRQAVLSPDSPGHYKNSGKILTMCLARKNIEMTKIIQNSWKNKYPSFAKFLAVIPILAHGPHKQEQQARPAQHNPAPAQQSKGRHILFD